VTKDAQRIIVTGLPTTPSEARNPRKWQTWENATVDISGDEYEIEFKHGADSEAGGQRPHLKLIRDGSTLFEIVLAKGKMNVNKGSDSENRMAKLDMDTCFTCNKFRIFNDGAKTPCLSVKSKGFEKEKEYLADGECVARQLSASEIEVGKGTDSLKVLTLFMLQWWHHVNDLCGPVDELTGAIPGLC